MTSKLLFLPGALGRTDFWVPAAELIRYPAKQIHFGWPGFGPTPAEPDVNGIDDLVDKLIAALDAPCALIAQSMGGIIAIRAALARPDLVTHLILAETSGGLDMTGLGAQDWRAFVRTDYPALPDWFLDYDEDLTERLAELHMPVLLLWGDADPISPVKVGEKLASCLPHADLHIVEGADHDLAYTHAAEVAALIDRHLGSANPQEERLVGR
jgi:pimeloyl-ACP methyl ester carboxylesterase